MPDSTNSPLGNPNQGHLHLSLRTTVILVLSMLALLFIMGSQDHVNGNAYHPQIASTPDITQSVTSITATPVLLIEKNAEYTTGLIFGAILLLLIIIIGTLAVIRHKE